MRRFAALNRHAFNSKVDIRGTIYDISPVGVLEVSDEHAEIIKDFKEYNEIIDAPVSPVVSDGPESTVTAVKLPEPLKASPRHVELGKLDNVRLMQLARKLKVKIINRQNSQIIDDIVEAENRSKLAEEAEQKE